MPKKKIFSVSVLRTCFPSKMLKKVIFSLSFENLLPFTIAEKKLFSEFSVLKTYFPSSSPASSCHPSVALRTFKHTNLFLEMQRWNRFKTNSNTKTNEVYLSGTAEMKSSSKNGMIPSLHVAFTKSVWIPYPLRFIWQNISDRQKTFGILLKVSIRNWLRTLTLIWLFLTDPKFLVLIKIGWKRGFEQKP